MVSNEEGKCSIADTDLVIQDKDQKYNVQTLLPDRVVLPPKFLPELRMQAGHKLNASEALVATTLGHHNGVDIILKDRQSNDVCRVQLTKSLQSIVPSIAHELDLVLREKLNKCSTTDYQSYNARDLVFALNLRTTSLSFAGSSLCHDPEWNRIITEYQDAVAGIAICLIPFPEILRPLVKPLLPATKNMRRIHESVRRCLFQSEKMQSKNSDEATVLKHYITTSKETNTAVMQEDIVAKFLVLSSAAVRNPMTIERIYLINVLLKLHTMTSATLHALFDLCTMPQYIEDLRSEAVEALEQTNGGWQLSTTKSMKLMDSFLKESQRLNPPNFRELFSDIILELERLS